LGSEEAGVYLLEGSDGYMIINGGMSYILPDILKQLKDLGINEDRITKLLILHAHFDHVGIIPFFKRHHPEMEVYGSSRAWEILEMPKAIEKINEFSHMVTERMGRAGDCSGFDAEWRDDVQGVSISEGDRIELGDTEVHIFETPGHSSCSISAYVPEFKALFPSDGGGIPYKNIIVAAGNSNYTKFQQSLQKLKDLDVEYICADHYGYVSGDEARDFVKQTIQAADQNRALMEEAYLRTRDVNTAAHEVTTAFFAQHPKYILSQEIFEGVNRHLLKKGTHDANDDCTAI
jgi:glyoxylase-like metal-dependent hydrolase (beta-lactamase superfamily II)